MNARLALHYLPMKEEVNLIPKTCQIKQRSFLEWQSLWDINATLDLFWKFNADEQEDKNTIVLLIAVLFCSAWKLLHNIPSPGIPALIQMDHLDL